MKGDISPKGISVQRGENIEGSSIKTIKDSVRSNQSKSTHVVKDNYVQGFAPNGDLGNLEVKFNMSSPKQRDGMSRTDGKQQMGFLGTGAKGYRSNGGKSSKSLKGQHPSSSSQRIAYPKNLQRSENGSISSRSKQSDKAWMGDLAPEQASGDSRRDHPANKGIFDKGIEMVRSGDGTGVEEHLPDHSGESQNWGNSAGPSGMGSDVQPMVEFHNGHPTDFMGGF